MAKDKTEQYGRGTVDFPETVETTRCETRSTSRLDETAHGTVKVIESVPVRTKERKA
jgi:hypothetical protein